MSWWDGFAAAGAFLLALAFSSFVEYAVHIAMHRRFVLGKVHAQHHKAGTGDGWLWEFLYYSAGAVPAAVAVLAIGYSVGWVWLAGGFAAGGIAYAAFAAYAHQVQHDRPELVFWMPMPVHTVHHRWQQWRVNFGIGVDVWDRLFGTYERVDWRPDPARKRKSLLDFFRIKWV